MNSLSKFFLVSLYITSNTLSSSSCEPIESFSGSVSSDISSSSSYLPRSYFGIRSQGANTARELIGWEELIYEPNRCDSQFVFSASFEYQTSFKPDRIANYLFGSSALHFSGSEVPKRDNIYSTQLVAENFGLPATFNQTLFIKPKIQNYIFDFDAYLGLNSLIGGLYLRLHAPLVLSKWSLFDSCYNSCVCSGSSSYENYSHEDSVPAYAPAGAYGINPASVLSPIPVNSNLREALSGNTFGDMQEPWSYGKFNFNPTLACRLADLDVIVGWNFWDCEDSHIGGFFQFVAPTGNKANPTYLFSPVIGNGKHYEFGAGLTAHSILWYGCADQSIGIYFEGNVTHLFKNTQKRSFDFKNNGPLSRYLLLKEIDTVSNMTNAYTGKLVNAINVTTREATVNIAVKGDASLKVASRNAGFGIDVGYNMYGLSKEKLCIKERSPSALLAKSPSVRYVIQGLQPTQGFNGCSGDFVTNNPQVLNLNSSNPSATIYNGERAISNPSLKQLAVPLGGEALPLVGIVVANPLAGNAVGQSTNLSACTTSDALVLNPAGALYYQAKPPVGGINDASAADFIASAAIDNQTLLGSFSISDVSVLDPLSGAAKSIITQKVFAFISYTSKDARGFIGIGGEVEFDGNGARKGGHDQWGLILKGGCAY